jgi:hypothetical protein
VNKNKLLVYVVFHSHWNYIDECMSSLHENLKTCDFEVLVINTTDSEQDFHKLERVVEAFDVKNIPGKLPLVINEVYAQYLDKYEFIMRLDADDFLYPGAIVALLSAIDNSNDIGAVYGSWSIVDNNSRITRRIAAPREEAGVGFHGACTLLRCSLLKGLSFRDLSIDSQDGFATYIFFQVNGIKISSVRNFIFGYRRHSSNLSSDNERLIRNRKRILSYFFNSQRVVKSNLFRLVFINTDLSELSDSDSIFVKAFDCFLVRNGIAKIGNTSLKIPQDVTLSEFFHDYYRDDNFVFINIEKLGSNYSAGLITSFVQYVSIMLPMVASYVEPITNKVLVVNDEREIKALNISDNISEFCFTELNGLHAVMKTDFKRNYAMYSNEILNKIINYDF